MTTGDPFDLSGKAGVVTGSSRGIGLAIARALLARGADLVINGYSEVETGAALDVLAAEYQSSRVVAWAGDVTDADLGPALVAESARVFGRLDFIICNAGIDIIKPAISYTPAEWDRVLAVNLRGAFQPAQAAARYWIDKGQAGGSITMTSSIAGSVGIAGLAPYAASKGGINQLVRTLASEWAPHGIRVNAVAPGYVANVMEGVTVHDDPQSDERIRAFTPMGRRATVDEIAAPYVFLASAAAAYVTGSILAADGGYTAT